MVFEGLDMRCHKCGVENPPRSRFCLECGATLTIPTTPTPSYPGASKSCIKCGNSNPPHAKFCFECGTLLEDDVQPQTHLCPTCGITADISRLFCPNCGQSLIERPLEITKPAPIPSRKAQIECPACGQITTGDYCRNCGYRLSVLERKRPIDWWYCDRDSAIMAEIDPNLQIPLSRKSLDESLAQAMDDNLLPHQDREKARSLALQLFEIGGTTNFEVITRVQCPVCSQQSLAPATRRPRLDKRPGFLPQLSLNATDILRNGIYYIRTYPHLLIILLVAVIIDVILILFGLSSLSLLDPNSFLVGSMTPDYLGFNYPMLSIYDLLAFFIISTIITFILNNLIQCWYFTSLKQIRANRHRSPLNLGESFKVSFVKFFPRAIGAQLIVAGISLGLTFGVIFVFFIVLFSIGTASSSVDYGFILVFLLVFIVALFGVLIAGFLFSIFFAYVTMSIVFDEAGVILSLKRSWRFARKYFWTTVGIILIFSFLPGALGFFLTPSLLLFGAQVTAMISSITSRSIEAYQVISLGWGFDEFKHMID